MSHTLRRLAPAALAVSGVIVVAGAGGAVAGAKITGAQIKDNTVSSADVKNLTLQASDTSNAFDDYMRRVSDYQVVKKTTVVPGGIASSAQTTCPDDTHVLGATGWWSASTNPVQVEALGDGTESVKVWGTNSGGGDDTLHVSIWCGRTAGE